MLKVEKKENLKPCRVCHRKTHWISRNGLCVNCVCEKVKLARAQIKCKEGPIYEKWKIKIMEGVTKL